MYIILSMVASGDVVSDCVIATPSLFPPHTTQTLVNIFCSGIVFDFYAPMALYLVVLSRPVDWFGTNCSIVTPRCGIASAKLRLPLGIKPPACYPSARQPPSTLQLLLMA